MKAIVKGIKSNGECFDYVVDDVFNVIYTNDNIILVLRNGDTVSYANTISKGYKYEILVMEHLHWNKRKLTYRHDGEKRGIKNEQRKTIFNT